MKCRASVNLIMTGSLAVTPKATERNLIVHIGKSEAKVTNNKRLHLRYYYRSWKYQLSGDLSGG